MHVFRRHAPYLAGLGSFGVNNVLLTPEFGPRVRFASVFTTAEFPPDPVIDADLCTRCIAVCPVGQDRDPFAREAVGYRDTVIPARPPLSVAT